MSRLESLKQQHSVLDRQIQLLQETYGKAEDITYLKKKKLKIKDEIYQRRKER